VRETSKVVVTYGTQLLNYIPNKDLYSEKYKGTMLCLIILTRALVGNYVNFGVFALYGDSALPDALSIGLKLAFSIPLQEALSYPKLARAFYGFIEILSNTQIITVVKLDVPTFTQLLVSLKEGLESLALGIVTQCCVALDRIISFRVNSVGKEKDLTAIKMITSHIAQHSDLLASMLTILFKRVLFEDCQNQWSLSRPMLALILLNPQYFNNIKSQLVSNQPVALQQRLIEDFESLMKDVNSSLEPANRDKFSQNLNNFVDSCKKYLC